MTTVIIEPAESFGSALRRFTKRCESSGLTSEPSKRQHHEKPSVKRTRTPLAARKKAEKRQRMSE